MHGWHHQCSALWALFLLPYFCLFTSFSHSSAALLPSEAPCFLNLQSLAPPFPALPAQTFLAAGTCRLNKLSAPGFLQNNARIVGKARTRSPEVVLRQACRLAAVPAAPQRAAVEPMLLAASPQALHLSTISLHRTFSRSSAPGEPSSAMSSFGFALKACQQARLPSQTRR